MEKDIFLKKVSELFLQNGAKSLTMDDIAKELRVSKKTLYKEYESKENLLEEILEFSIEKVLFKMRHLDENIDNAIERMFKRDEDIEKASRANNSIMLRQLMKYYPQIFHKHMLYLSKKLSELLVHNVERGRNQGLYREDFDAELYSKLFFQMTMSYNNSPFLNTTQICHSEYQQESLLFYMNAITTEEGKRYMKKLLEKDCS